MGGGAMAEGVPPLQTGGSGSDPLQREMEKHGLTPADQATLIHDGVTTLQVFQMLDDANFQLSGIDIVARRAAKATADQAALDAKGVRELLQREGSSISTAGQAAIIQCAGTPTKLCTLDLPAMKALGLGIADRGILDHVVRTSPTVIQWRSQILRWVVADPWVDIKGEGGALAVNSPRPLSQSTKNGFGAAFSDKVIQGDGDSYAEFTWVTAGSAKWVAFGLVRHNTKIDAPLSSGKVYQNTQPILHSLPGAWMYVNSNHPQHDSGVYTDGAILPWSAGSACAIQVGQTVGLHLHNEALSVYVDGRHTGDVSYRFVGRFRWAVDMYAAGEGEVAASVRIALKWLKDPPTR